MTFETFDPRVQDLLMQDLLMQDLLMQESAAVVQDLPLWDRTCNEILEKTADLTDPDEPSVYREELLWHTDEQDPKPVCLPPYFKMLIGQLQKRNGYRWLAEPFRRLVLHGLAIHDHAHGNRLHALMARESIQNGIVACDKRMLDVLQDGIKCDFLSKRCTSVRFSEDFYNMIEEGREEAGICDREKFVAYLVVLSLRTHPDLTGWYPEFDVLISNLHRKMDARIERLEAL